MRDDFQSGSSKIHRIMHTILATRDTQFGHELALVMQTTHAQRWQYPDVSTRVCFLPLKMYTGITKILEVEYETCMFYKIPSWFIETFGCIFKI